jgi:hypothetical protein
MRLEQGDQISLRKKSPQNVAQPIYFVTNQYTNFTVEKSSPKSSAASIIFEKL